MPTFSLRSLLVRMCWWFLVFFLAVFALVFARIFTPRPALAAAPGIPKGLSGWWHKEEMRFHDEISDKTAYFSVVRFTDSNPPRHLRMSFNKAGGEIEPFFRTLRYFDAFTATQRSVTATFAGADAPESWVLQEDGSVIHTLRDGSTERLLRLDEQDAEFVEGQARLELDATFQQDVLSATGKPVFRFDPESGLFTPLDQRLMKKAGKKPRTVGYYGEKMVTPSWCMAIFYWETGDSKMFVEVSPGRRLEYRVYKEPGPAKMVLDMDLAPVESGNP